MQVIVLLSAVAVALLLARRQELRGVFVAATISSSAAGLWILLLPVLVPDLRMEGIRMTSAGVPVAAGVIYSVVVMLGLTIVPNLVTLGLVRRWLMAGREAASRWTALTRSALLVPAGVVYGELVQIATLLMWTLLFALALRDANPLRVIPSYLSSPLLHVTAALGGITAIGVQAGFDRWAARRQVR